MQAGLLDTGFFAGASVLFLVCATLLSFERLAYAWIWIHPNRFRTAAAERGIPDPVRALERLFLLFKLLQLGTFAAWISWFGARTGWPTHSAPGVTALAVTLLIGGQTLNAAVFLRLGRIGVFYGNRFGHVIPWQNGFPFSLLRNPQYAGTLASIWGLFLLLRYPHPDWLVLPLLQT
ncbi:MAG: methyltransferase, partial [Gammaproteobacteria bacterium]